jgi:hypothetical protein
MKQPAWWCRACGHSTVFARGWCRACYDRQHRFDVFFAGHREAVLARDRCCQLCWSPEQLIVHHRRPGVNRPGLHITLCRRCHVPVHRRHCPPAFCPALFLCLWQEAHPGWPVQLSLAWSRPPSGPA